MGPFLASADAQVREATTCRDYTRIDRTCEVVRGGGRGVLHCSETREVFKLCSDGETQHTEKLSTTSIETREPLLEGSTLVATRPRWELSPSRSGDSASSASSAAVDPAAPASASLAPSSAAPAPAQGQPPSPSGRRAYRPWTAHADDGGGTAAGAGFVSTAGVSPERLMTPRVGQAMDEVIQLAGEVQREMAQQGVSLVRKGEEQQRRRQGGLLSRLFGSGVDAASEPGRTWKFQEWQ
ncbi:hypothetical protein HYH03_008196 [Edaphochlamys debaryana]|uniref:Uncharacterized protein n=1 Tax=Edaphochlamys debaryana TaxID=47281 RepID=A0A835XZ30_9CHLO|nr:hypothetical protein HYH03_008196 [Edaphochlamys debaryana]|eukprot:KAG2493682.1 hypothetical protein HYH03_008196 [Edaphochlamys debaryana]